MLNITDEVVALLGKSREEIAAMTLGAFSDLVWDKGFAVRADGFDKRTDEGSLTIRVVHDDLPKSTV